MDSLWITDEHDAAHWVVISAISHISSRGKGGSRGAVIYMLAGEPIFTKQVTSQLVADILSVVHSPKL